MQQPHPPLAASCFSSCLLPSFFEGGFGLPAIAVHPVFQGVPTLPSLMGDTSGLFLSLACGLLIFYVLLLSSFSFSLLCNPKLCRQDEGMYGGSSFSYAIATVGVRLIMANLRFHNLIALPGVAAPPGLTL